VRERSTLGGLGVVVGGPFQRALDRATERSLAQGYDWLVERVRNGPPLRMAAPGLRTLVNLSEFAVHHEDVRRANGLGPRTDRPDLQQGLWRVLRRGAGLQLRKVRKDLRVHVVPEGVDGDVSVGSGPEVTLRGEPLELVLYLMGRKAAAVVELHGDPGAVAVLESASLGI
jgi:uncharacterized protein (TIGR03085 family)